MNIEEKIKNIIKIGDVSDETFWSVVDYMNYLKEANHIKSSHETLQGLSNNKDFLMVAWVDNDDKLHTYGTEIK